MRSHRLDVEIVFAAKNRTLRADVDNIAKPILDALKSIAYDDDRQLRSIRVVALPLDDAYGIRGRVDGHTMSRLLKTDEFLVNIYNGLHLDLDLVELVSSPERADS
jgi:hypothetical protein